MDGRILETPPRVLTVAQSPTYDQMMNDSTLTLTEIETAANQLLDGRKERQTLTTVLPAPKTFADAYAIQDRVVKASGRPVAGWKIGATSAFAQEFLGCDGPFAAPIFADDMHSSGVAISAGDLLNPMMEPEIAVTIAEDFAPFGAVDSNDVEAVIRDVRPSIELVGGCFPDISTCGVLSVVADRGANLGVVLGEITTDWQSVDLGAVAVTLRKNDAQVGEGVGADALGGPLHALAWLVNHLADRGLSLRAGDVVTTGTCGGVALLAPGDVGEATHGQLGGVRFTYG